MTKQRKTPALLSKPKTPPPPKPKTPQQKMVLLGHPIMKRKIK